MKEAQETPEPRRKFGCGSLVISGVVAVVIAGVVTLTADDDSGPEDRSGYAKVACHGFVKDRLKSPGSAKFSNEVVNRRGVTRYV